MPWVKCCASTASSGLFVAGRCVGGVDRSIHNRLRSIGSLAGGKIGPGNLLALCINLHTALARRFGQRVLLIGGRNRESGQAGQQSGN
ncbi:UTP-glucose-1-phosphate uridylyltransferase [Pseudomonas syringae pv. actinidiae]|uniref:UTP-glucose-1-phosphate uridylyltransferase n=1 Tax=Pseudomonas syringae pv. actinidiae TaxID=103796 RepID=A0A2V0QFC7_PSESF|nr:UTP-glucose-1-phosphate uridylyltransferase [Pseudomonas syringae pv. actinidiae]